MESSLLLSAIWVWTVGFAGVAGGTQGAGKRTQTLACCSRRPASRRRGLQMADLVQRIWSRVREVIRSSFILCGLSGVVKSRAGTVESRNGNYLQMTEE